MPFNRISFYAKTIGMTDVAYFNVGTITQPVTILDFEANKLGGDSSHALGATLSLTIFDHDIATLDPAEFPQSLYKCRSPHSPGRGVGAQEPDDRHLARLLRAV